MFHTAQFMNMTGVVYFSISGMRGISKHVIVIIVIGVKVHLYMRHDTLMHILGVVHYVLVHVSVADDAYMQVQVQFQLFRVVGAYILHICI